MSWCCPFAKSVHGQWIARAGAWLGDHIGSPCDGRELYAARVRVMARMLSKLTPGKLERRMSGASYTVMLVHNTQESFVKLHAFTCIRVRPG